MKSLKKILMYTLCAMLIFTASPFTIKTNATETDSEDDSGNYTENLDDDMETNTSSSVNSDSDSDSDSDDTDDSKDKDNTITNINSKIMLADNWETPTAVYGQRVSVVLPLVNMDKTDIYDIIVTPEISTDTESFPFEIEKSGYIMEIDNMPGENSVPDIYERRREVTYDFKTRKDVKSGYYKVNFNIMFTTAEGTADSTTVEMFVKSVGVNGSDSDNASIPRVIVTGFSTDPENVKAGEDFNLTIHLKNTSKSTKVSNLKIDLEAVSDGKDENTTYQAFLPVEGSSTLYVNSIAPDTTQDVSIAMNAKADLTQKPYVLSVKMEYEDGSHNQLTSDSDLSIPVHQDARFDISKPEVMPSSIDVNSESNIVFSIYNTGKTQLYNVTVAFEAESITGGDTFVGNIASGETGNVDAMVTGLKATTDDGTVKIIINYEDEAGKASKVEKTLTLNVTEMSMDENMNNEMFLDEEIENENKSSSGKIIIILIIIIIILAAIVMAVKFWKKKKDMKHEQELLSEIDDDDYINDDISDVTEDSVQKSENEDKTDMPKQEADLENKENDDKGES